jgi:hypothetical protein
VNIRTRGEIDIISKKREELESSSLLVLHAYNGVFFSHFQLDKGEQGRGGSDQKVRKERTTERRKTNSVRRRLSIYQFTVKEKGHRCLCYTESATEKKAIRIRDGQKGSSKQKKERRQERTRRESHLLQ